jgi:hypothetical protein
LWPKAQWLTRPRVNLGKTSENNPQPRSEISAKVFERKMD